MRPPTRAAFSNSDTSWPAWTRVRAQTTPAMPAPTMAKWRGAEAEAGALELRLRRDAEEGRVRMRFLGAV